MELGVLYSRPLVSSNVIALILSEQSIASLSTRLPSSTFDLRADRMTHIEHRFTFTARRLARFNEEPYMPEIKVQRLKIQLLNLFKVKLLIKTQLSIFSSSAGKEMQTIMLDYLQNKFTSHNRTRLWLRIAFAA